MNTVFAFRMLAVFAFLAVAIQAQESIELTGIVRDFEELKEKQATGGHPDFNPNWDPQGWSNWGCFDNPQAAKGAIANAQASSGANPANLPGLVPYDRDEVGPALKPAFTAPPNCFRSRFGEWYATHGPDINRAFFLDLKFVKEGEVYKYDNPEFFPMDDSKLGALRPQVPSVTTTFGHRQTGTSDGIDLATHNYGFTFEFHARFAYRKGKGQRFDFRGDDDVWVFINDSLVIDLGGLHPAEFASVDLDALGLADGKAYFLDFYFAERRISSSRLTITTSLELKNSDKPIDPIPVRAVEGWLYDGNGDGIADKAEIAFDKQPDKTPTAFELNLAGETARGGWDVTAVPVIPAIPGKVALQSLSGFFSKPVTGWDENDPANLGKAFNEPATGLLEGSFPLHDRIGPVIDKAWKILLDTSLNQVPKPQIRIRFSEPVALGSAAAFKFMDKLGVEKRVEFIDAVPDSARGGLSVSWSLTLSPGSPNVPGVGWKVAIAEVAQVKDGKENPANPANPWRPIDAKLPAITIGDLRAEKRKPVVVGAVPTGVKKPFVLLTSKQIPGAELDYIPLHPETAEKWILGIPSGGGPEVFGFKLSHPAKVSLNVFDNLGQFVNRTDIVVTREDLHSGKLARDPVTRAYLLRLGWLPVSHDGNRISTGAYILKAHFKYGLDERDYVERGSQVKVSRFGYVRETGMRGLGLP